jgi:hypothetical protein
MTSVVISLPTAAASPIRQLPAFRHPSLPDNVVRLPRRQPAQDRRDFRGRLDGYREFRAPTQHMTKAWRELAAAHEAARVHLNSFTRGGDYPWSGQLDLDDPETQEAMTEYRCACAALLTYPDPKPRHMSALVACAAEIAAVGEPNGIDATKIKLGSSWR